MFLFFVILFSEHSVIVDYQKGSNNYIKLSISLLVIKSIMQNSYRISSKIHPISLSNGFIILLMTQSPRKRILTQIGSGEPPKISRIRLGLPNNRFQRLSEVFKFSPTHSRELSIPQLSFGSSGRSKYHSNIGCLQQLNSIFKLRKINQEKSFFEDRAQNMSHGTRSKSKINKDIEHSIIYIQNLKGGRSFTQANQQAESYMKPRRQNNKESVIEAIGLELPEIKNKMEENARFLTEPTITQPRKKSKKKQQIGLYSYLERDFIEKKTQQLTDKKIIDYAKNPNNRNFHRIMLQKSRKFLKQTVENNYRELPKINNVIQEESKKMIQLELNEKKKKYEKDYFARNNVPYFSFLTLKQKEKESVLKAIHSKKATS